MISQKTIIRKINITLKQYKIACVLKPFRGYKQIKRKKQ